MKNIKILYIIVGIIVLVGALVYYFDVYFFLRTPNFEISIPTKTALFKTTNQVDQHLREEIISGLFKTKKIFETRDIKVARTVLGLDNNPDESDEVVRVSMVGATRSKLTAEDIRSPKTTWFFGNSTSSVTIVVHTGLVTPDTINGERIDAYKINGVWVWH